MGMNLLVVDDEPMILDFLSSIPWNTIGVDRMFKASSSPEALDILTGHPIRIVITDIKMPGMSGLELCESIHNHWRDVKCMLLSGHADFEYAKTALHTGVVDYLLKPVKKQEILQKVQSTIAAMLKEDEERTQYLEKIQALRRHLPLIKSNALLELLAGKVVSARAAAQRLHDSGVPFGIDDLCSIVLVKMDRRFKSFDEDSQALYRYAINNMAEEIMGERFHIWSCTDPYNYQVFILREQHSGGAASDTLSVLCELSRELQDKVSFYLKGSISIAVGGMGKLPGQLPELYQSTVSVLRRLSAREQGAHIRVWDIDPHSLYKPLRFLQEPPTFFHLCESGRLQDARHRLNKLARTMIDEGMDSAEHLAEVFSYLSGALAAVPMKSGHSCYALMEDKHAASVQPDAFRTVEQLQQWCMDMLDRMGQSHEFDHTASQQEIVVRRIRQYIDQHLDEATLQTIADHVSVHPAYASSLYKQVTKENLSDYILRLRLEKAGFMLRNTHQKIYDIARTVGYRYTAYFGKLFKQHYGVTPQEYRDKFQ